jgi:hypothetical protein
MLTTGPSELHSLPSVRSFDSSQPERRQTA